MCIQIHGILNRAMNDYINNMNLKGWMNNALGDINKTNDSNEQKDLKAVINID